MSDQELRDLLEKLHAELECTETVDEKGLELLLHLRTDIGELLNRAEGASVRPGPLTVNKLKDTVAHLELEHPKLTLLISRLLNDLSNAGI